jgi:hypothetical protein
MALQATAGHKDSPGGRCWLELAPSKRAVSSMAAGGRAAARITARLRTEIRRSRSSRRRGFPKYR